MKACVSRFARVAARSARASSSRSKSRTSSPRLRVSRLHNHPLTRQRRRRTMREYVWLECTACGARNYRTQKETRGAERLELKKFCRKERKHTPHKESRKK